MGQLHRGRSVVYFGLVVAAVAVACTDNPTQPGASVKPPSELQTATAVGEMLGRIVFAVDTGVIRAAPLRAAANFQVNDHGGDWAPVGRLVADTNAFMVKSLSRRGPAANSTKRSPIGFTPYAASPKARGNEPAHVRIFAMPVMDGHVPTFLVVPSAGAANGEPPRVTVLLVDGIPVIATERQYHQVAGQWTTASEVTTLFDDKGKQLASVRTDGHRGHKTKTGQPESSPDNGSFNELSALSGAADAVLRVVGGIITPASLYAQETTDCSALYNEMRAAQTAAAAAVIAAKEAAEAAAPWIAACATICFFDPLTCAFTPVCIRAAELTALAATLAAAAYYATKFAKDKTDEYNRKCKCAGFGAEYSGAGGAAMAAPSDHGNTRKSQVSVTVIDLSHINRGGRWVHESLHLTGRHAPAFQ